MHWLKTSEERQADYVLENPAHPIAKALMFLGGERTITGRAMNDGRALSLSGIYNAVSLISGDLATSPMKLYRKTDNGGREEENGHALWDRLTLQPTHGVTSAALREALQGHLLLRGNCYAEIVRDGAGRVVELKPHNPDDIMRKPQPDGSWFYVVVSEKRFIAREAMLHIPGPGGNGIDGWSVIKLARENWALASALEESNARFIANGSRPSGFLTTEASMKPETLKKIKDLWGKRNAGLDNVGGTPVLDGGFTWQQIGLTAEDTQYIDSRKLSITDIARWFNVPPHKIKDLERATFSNVEEQSIDYVRGTLRPWAVRWEQHASIKLLTEAERRSGLYLKINLDALLRGDVQARSEAYRTQFEMGALTPNEIRALEERNPIPDGDDAYVRLDMAPLGRLEEIQSDSGSDEDQRAETRARREVRSPDMRLQLRSSFGPLIMQGADRMVKGEIRNVKRMLKKRDSEGWTDAELRQRIESYYFDDHPPFASGIMGPVFRAFAESMANIAAEEVDTDVRIDALGFADEYTDGFVSRYSARSRRDLTDREPDAIEERLSVWADGYGETQARHVQVADRETVKLGDFITRQAFIAGGVMSLVWRTVGDTCPYCTKLNGVVVDRSASFIQAGEAFEADGADVPLVPKNNIAHAPAHRGCDCTIVPGGF